MYNERNEIIEWYFDVAREIGKENGVPYEDDLYLDVVVMPTGKIILLDEDKLKDAYERLEVNKIDYDMASTEAKNLIKQLNIGKLNIFTNRYLKEMMGDDT